MLGDSPARSKGESGTGQDGDWDRAVGAVLPGEGLIGILESPPVRQFKTIGIVIVRSASPSPGNEKLLNSLQPRLAQGIDQ
jgi:hypothetical protein